MTTCGRNPLFDVVVEIEAPSLVGKSLGPRLGKRYGAIADDLKRLGATPKEIRIRWAECRRLYPMASIRALVNHWDALVPKVMSYPGISQEQFLESKRRSEEELRMAATRRRKAKLDKET